MVSVSTPLPGGGQPAQTTSTQYDLNGRVHIVTHPDGTASTNTYFPTGLLATSQGSRTFPVSYTYDRQGRLATLTTWTNRASASNPAVTTWTYHPSRGWLTAKTYPGDTVGPTFTYTTGGRLKTRTWARSAAVGSPIVTTWKYGFDDAATGNQHSDPVEVSYNDGRTPALATAYDRLGRVRSLTTGGTNVLVRTLDPAGLVLGEGYTAGPLSGIYLTNTFDARGRRYTLAPRSGAAALGQTVTQSYDTAGRLQSFHDGTYSATYTYLPNSPLWESLEFQGSAVAATTTRSFDYLDRLVSISTQPGDPGSTPPLVFAYAYNAANQRVSRTDPDGSFWTFGYDSLAQVTNALHFWHTGAPIAGQQFQYLFDDIGNRRVAREGGNTSGTGLRTSSWTPNALNQIVSRTVPAALDVTGLANANASVTVNAQAASRQGAYYWKELPVTNASNPALTPVTVAATLASLTATTNRSVLTPPANQTFAHDADGNLTNDSVWSYTWDAENRLLAMETLTNVLTTARARVTWDYDPAGRRLRQAVATNWTGSAYGVTNETRYLYDGWACVAELNAVNGLLRQYAWGLDLSGTTTGAGGVGGLLWVRPAGGPAHFAACDGNGNVVGLVDGSTGTVSARYDYDPFGTTLRMTGPMARENSFRFSTKRADDTTGIVLYEYRPYAPALGRWPNRDPIGEKGGMNLYAAFRNQPTQLYDLHGLKCARNKCDYWRLSIVTMVGGGANGAVTIAGGEIAADPRCCMDWWNYHARYTYVGVGLGIGVKALDWGISVDDDDFEWFDTPCISIEDHAGFGRITNWGIGVGFTFGAAWVTTPYTYQYFAGPSYGLDASVSTTVGYWAVQKQSP